MLPNFIKSVLRRKEGAVAWSAIVTITPLLVGVLMVANVLSADGNTGVKANSQQDISEESEKDVTNGKVDSTVPLGSRFDTAKYIEAEIMGSSIATPSEAVSEVESDKESGSENDDEIRTYGNSKAQKSSRGRVRLDASLKLNP